MPENANNKGKPPTAEAQQEAAQTNDAKAEATGTASDELSEGALKAVAGDYNKPPYQSGLTPTPKWGPAYHWPSGRVPSH
jgi:hypothetical protein